MVKRYFDAFSVLFGKEGVTFNGMVIFIRFTESVVAGSLVFFFVFKKRNDVIDVFIKLEQAADALFLKMFKRIDDKIV